MQFRSTESGGSSVSFKEAMLQCLPQGGGLYVPDRMMDIRQFFMHMDEGTSFHELVAAIAPCFI